MNKQGGYFNRSFFCFLVLSGDFRLQYPSAALNALVLLYLPARG